jgi:hypothetical protein
VSSCGAAAAVAVTVAGVRLAASLTGLLVTMGSVTATGALPRRLDGLQLVGGG